MVQDTVSRLVPYLDTFIDLGFIGLLLLTPLPRGSVRNSAEAVAQFAIVLVFAAWLLKIIWGPAPLAVSLDRKGQPDHSGRLKRRRRREFLGGRLALSGLEWPALLFVFVILFQMVPLPLSWIKTLSPRRAQILSESFPEPGKGALSTRKFEAWLLSRNRDAAQMGQTGGARLENADSMVPDEELESLSTGRRSLSMQPAATARHLWTYLGYFMIFMVGIHHWRDRRNADRIIVSMAVMAGVMGAYGILQVLAGEAGLGRWLRKAGEGRVPAGPFVNANHFAGYMEMVLPVTLGLAMMLYEKARSEWDPTVRLLDRGERVLPRLLLLSIIMVLGGVALLACRSRGGLLSLAVATTFFFLLSPFRQKVKIRTGLLGLLFVGLAVAVVLRMGGDQIWTRYSTLADPGGEPSFSFRVDTAQRTLRMAADFPVVGVGLGAFRTTYPLYASGGRARRTGFAHNDYAQLLAETGLAGGILACIAFLVLIFRFHRMALLRGGSARRHVVHGLAVGVASLLIHSLFDFNLQIYSNGLLFVVLVGLLVADGSSRLDRRSAVAAGLSPRG